MILSEIERPLEKVNCGTFGQEMQKSWRNSWAAVIALLASGNLRADLISEALFSFPSQTGYVEYDNLASLRTLADYNALRQRFSGKSLEDAKATLAHLGIEENQVLEIVSASNSTAFFGLVAGTFSGRSKKITERHIICPAGGTCVVFLEDSLAAFGAVAELKEILETRQGVKTRLSANRDIASLLNNTDSTAPVRGVVFGGQLAGNISDMLRDWSGWNRDWSTFSANIKAMGYGLKFDSKAHVSAKLECASKTTAVLLVQTLSALGSLQSMTPANIQNLNVSSSGALIDLKLDTAIPSGH